MRCGEKTTCDGCGCDGIFCDTNIGWVDSDGREHPVDFEGGTLECLMAGDERGQRTDELLCEDCARCSDCETCSNGLDAIRELAEAHDCRDEWVMLQFTDDQTIETVPAAHLNDISWCDRGRDYTILATSDFFGNYDPLGLVDWSDASDEDLQQAMDAIEEL